MSFNNVPINGWPQIKDLEKLDALAKSIEDMPTFTSNDKAFLEELPAFPLTDGKKVLTATTSEGITSLNYEEIMAGVDYSTTEQKTGQKWIDGRDIYQSTIEFGALPNATSKTYDITSLDIDIIINKSAVAFNNDKSSLFILPHLSLNVSSSISLDANQSIVAITTGMDRSSITNCYVTITYVKTAQEG